MVEEEITTGGRETEQRNILNRLNRAQGQLGAVIAAVENGKSCREIVTQLSAVSSALDKAGFAIVASAMTHCVAEHGEPSNVGAGWPADRSIALDELEKIFLMLA